MKELSALSQLQDDELTSSRQRTASKTCGGARRTGASSILTVERQLFDHLRTSKNGGRHPFLFAETTCYRHCLHPTVELSP